MFMVDVELRKVSSEASTSKCGCWEGIVPTACDWLWTPVVGTFSQAAKPRDPGANNHAAQLYRPLP